MFRVPFKWNLRLVSPGCQKFYGKQLDCTATLLDPRTPLLQRFVTKLRKSETMIVHYVTKICAEEGPLELRWRRGSSPLVHFG